MKKQKYIEPTIEVIKFVSRADLMGEGNPNEGDGNIINLHGTSETDIENGDFDPSFWNH